MRVVTETAAERERRRVLAKRRFLTPEEAGFLFVKSKRTINRWITDGLPVHVDEATGRRYVLRTDVVARILDPSKPTRRSRRVDPGL